ncbi:MAG: cation diffusion facilitator family transporter [Vicinamibacterales bacterium]
MIDRHGNERALRRAVVLTTVYLVAEVVGGVLTGSLALLADAGHMFTDVGGLVLALLAIRLTRRAPTPEHSFGYYRAEVLAAAINAVVLFGISGVVLIEAYRRFSAPPEVQSLPMLAIAVVGLAVNGITLFALHGQHEGLNVKGAYFEVLSDLITSVGVIVGAGVIAVTGWNVLDPIISAGIGLFIVPRTWLLLSDAVSVLLEGTPKDVDVQALRGGLQAIAGVADVHDLHVWSLTSGVNALSVHVAIADADAGLRILREVQDTARERFAIEHATVQIEPPGFVCGEPHV